MQTLTRLRHRNGVAPGSWRNTNDNFYVGSGASNLLRADSAEQNRWANRCSDCNAQHDAKSVLLGHLGRQAGAGLLSNAQLRDSHPDLATCLLHTARFRSGPDPDPLGWTANTKMLTTGNAAKRPGAVEFAGLWSRVHKSFSSEPASNPGQPA
jgi:hypothetical protein